MQDQHQAVLGLGQEPENRVLGKTVEFEALHRDGHLLPVEVSTWVTYIGDAITFSALLHGITDRRKGEEAIGRLG